MKDTDRVLRSKVSGLLAFLTGLRELGLELNGLRGLQLGLSGDPKLRNGLKALSLLLTGLGSLGTGLFGLRGLLLKLDDGFLTLDSLDPSLRGLLQDLDADSLQTLLPVLKDRSLALCSALPAVGPAC